MGGSWSDGEDAGDAIRSPRAGVAAYTNLPQSNSVELLPRIPTSGRGAEALTRRGP
jgi:hypothetical protein